ncbi:hypothetical protein ACS0TY_001750 [Phlomoides rotata]
MEATRTLILGLMVIAAAVSVMGKENEDGSICGVSQGELMDCKPAVATGTAAPPPPSPGCCAALKHANLTCFCTFKSNPYLPFLGINGTRAMQLPSKCDPTQSAHC